MKKVTVYEIPALYRQNFIISGYQFGEGEKTLAVVGSLRGNEYQQIYTCSQLVRMLKELEAAGKLPKDREILVIPSLNPYSMNIGKRFWPTDNTDINRMFPGYAQGETTQRIAAAVFDVISKYKNGIQFASFYMPGKFLPHVRMMRTGYENIQKASLFGLPHVIIREPRPYDTTTLNYNWQIWETNAYSLYTTTTGEIDEISARDMVDSILRFLGAEGILKETPGGGRVPLVWNDRDMVNIRPEKAGIFRSRVMIGQKVRAGDKVAEIMDPGEGGVLEELYAPMTGVVFFLHTDPLTYASTAVIKLLPMA